MRGAWAVIRLIPAFAVWPLVMAIALFDHVKKSRTAA